MRVVRGLQYCFSVKAYNATKNYYKILNISENASQDDIKKAFRNLAKKYHPDTTKGKEEEFKEVNQAYQVLSDTSVKQEYDQVRTVNNASNYTQNQRGYQTGPHQGYNSSQHYQQHPQSNYRGYQPQQGWNNRTFRQQFMNDLYRQQYNEQMRQQFQQAEREQMQRAFRQMMRQATRRNPNEHIKQYNQQMRAKQAEARRRYEEQMRREQQREYEQYRRYRDQNYSNSAEKVKQQLNKVADKIATNVKDALKVGEQLKDLWNKFKQNNKK